jgi:hypothetical protein
VDAERFKDAGARRPFGKIASVRRTDSFSARATLIHLVKRDALGFGDLARLSEQRRLQPQCEIAPLHCSFANRLSASAGDSTAMPSCWVASARSRRVGRTLYAENCATWLSS